MYSAATSADRQAIAMLMQLITKLSTQLEQQTKEIAALKKPRTSKKDQGSYCWSHGYLVHKNHNSQNCRNPKPNHCREATCDNPMGGNMEGKPEWLIHSKTCFSMFNHSSSPPSSCIPVDSVADTGTTGHMSPAIHICLTKLQMTELKLNYQMDI